MIFKTVFLKKRKKTDVFKKTQNIAKKKKFNQIFRAPFEFYKFYFVQRIKSKEKKKTFYPKTYSGKAAILKNHPRVRRIKVKFTLLATKFNFFCFLKKAKKKKLSFRSDGKNLICK